MTARGLTPEQRFWLKVDRTEGCWLWTGALDSWKYGQIRIAGHNVLVHRFSYALHVGPIPEGMTVDHRIDCPKHCVNPAHLRLATIKQQQENRGAQANSKSGVRGVYHRKDRDRWAAQVRHHGKCITVGYFKTRAEAEAAVVAKRIEVFTHNDGDRLARA